MKKKSVYILSCIFLATLFLSACATQQNCAAYGTYPKKSKGRTK